MVGVDAVRALPLNMCAQPVWPRNPPSTPPDAVDAYKPVCAQPNDYDADGSVLRSMADSLLRFWHHCYGSDGQGGAVAAVSAAAQQALHQLAAVPLPASQGGSSLWCEGLFKGREEVSSAFSVAHFLRTQQVGCEWRLDGLGLYGCAAVQQCCRAAFLDSFSPFNLPVPSSSCAGGGACGRYGGGGARGGARGGSA